MEASIVYSGVEMVVIYDYQEGEEQTWDYPGSAPEIEVEAIFAKDSEVDLFDIFTWDQIEDLENILLEIITN